MEYNKRILVTGGLGFIGSNFLSRHVLSNPHFQFINLDAGRHGSNQNNLSPAIRSAQNYVFVSGDIASRVVVDETMMKYKITDVIHFAAESHVDRSIDHSELFVMSNVYGTEILLRAFAEYAPKHGIFLHISTDEVYGDAENTGEQWNEASLIAPRNIYSATKAAAEHLVRAYGNTHGINYIITRGGNNYGPRQDDSKFLPKMIKNALDGGVFEVYGDGTNFRQWTHVYDHVDAIMTLFESSKTGETYNIAGKDILTNNQVIELIVKMTNSSSKIVYVKDRPGHDKGYSIDCSKIRDDIGWTPSIDFEYGLMRYIAEKQEDNKKL